MNTGKSSLSLFFERNFFQKQTFWYGSLLVIIVFLITRLPYYLYYSFTSISFDTASYCAAAINILESRIPLFEIRPPGYSLFLSVIWSFSKDPFYISLIQSLLTLFISIFFLWAMYKTYKPFVFFFAIAISIFISSSAYLVLETALLADSIFVNFLILSSTFLILALKKNKPVSWISFSISMALAILIRPVGLFFCSVIILLLLFFIIKKYKFKFYLMLVVPFSIIILSLCLYNYFTLKAFSITSFGESNFSGVTILFMEPSKEYPPYVNDAIKKTLDEIPKKDIPYVRNSYGITKLYNTFCNNFFRQLYLFDNLMKQDSTLTFADIQPITRRVYIDAIKKYPHLYGKFFFSNFFQFFRNISIKVDFYKELGRAYENTILEKAYVNELVKGGWLHISSNKMDYEKVISFYSEQINTQTRMEYVINSESSQIEMKSTFLKSVYEIYEEFYNFCFRNIIWLILFAVTLSISIYKSIKSRFADIDAFIFLLFAVMFLTKAFVVSTVNCSLVRYSLIVEFVLFFSLPFLIIFLKKPYKLHTH